jgi:hypothetical protein
MKRLLLLVTLGAALVSSHLAAQSSPAPIKYGKWILLAGAVGMNVAAANAHRDADRYFDQLDDRCATDETLCEVGPGGAYRDAESERLYQASLTMDRRARGWLFGGETAALGAAVLFVWEFARPKGPPENIPFAPKVSSRAGGTDIGVMIRF